MSKNVWRRGLVVAAGLCAVAFPLFAKPAPESEAVKQQIFVEPVQGMTDDFMRGVDISMVHQIEKSGGKFYNAQGQEQDVFQILKDNGVNWIRIRLWNKPTYENDVYDKNGQLVAKKGASMGGGANDLAVDLEIARRIKACGLKFLLDFHYSDFWADPGKQYMPQDWKGLDEKQLNAAVQKFTRGCIQAFIDQGTRPDMVQIGNELDSGFMWPVGQLWSDDPSVKIGGFKGFTTLLKSASAGVREVQGSGEKIKIAVHLADGGNNGKYRWIFDEIKKSKLDYDAIGMSYYNYWHGSLESLKANMVDIGKRYGKEMFVAETAYAFTTEDGDDQGNVFMIYSDEAHGYVPSVQGQATAVRDVIDTVASVKGGVGVFYWEADSILVPGAHLSATEGNTWENQAMFDFGGRALPSLAVWNLVCGKGEVENVWGGSARIGSGAAPYALAEELVVQTKPALAPSLPAKVKVVFSDDSERLVDVSWETHDWAAEKNDRMVDVNGKISGDNPGNFVPVAKVNVTSIVNLVEDASFESGKLGAWKLNGPGAACFLENNKSNARTGKWTYKYWLANGFRSILSREFKNIDNGTYRLSVWAMGGGGENNIRLFAANYDGSGKNTQITSKITNTAWQEWHQFTIEVPVTANTAIIGIYLDTNPDCWGNFDDIEFIKIGD